jgi:hypothetical protein
MLTIADATSDSPSGYAPCIPELEVGYPLLDRRSETCTSHRRIAPEKGTRKTAAKELARAGGRTAAKVEANNFRREIDDRDFFKLRSFAIVDVLQKWVTVNASYFMNRVIILRHQRRLASSAEIARRKLRLHFDNLPRHAAVIVTQGMQRLRCEHVSHPAYSLDLAICDFSLLGRLKQQLQPTDLFMNHLSLVNKKNGTSKVAFPSRHMGAHLVSRFSK